MHTLAVVLIVLLFAPFHAHAQEQAQVRVPIKLVLPEQVSAPEVDWSNARCDVTTRHYDESGKLRLSEAVFPSVREQGVMLVKIDPALFEQKHINFGVRVHHSKAFPYSARIETPLNKQWLDDPPKVLEVQLAAHRYAMLRFKITEPDGAPATNRTIRLLKSIGESLHGFQQATTDAEGLVHFEVWDDILFALRDDSSPEAQ